MPGGTPLPSADAAIAGSVWSNPQFKSSFWSSFLSSAAIMALQGVAAKTMANYDAKYNPLPADFQIANDAFMGGTKHFQEKSFAEAVKEFVFAKEHFEKVLHKYTASNPRLHQLYIEICYNLALSLIYCNKLSDAKDEDTAENVLSQLEEKLKAWQSKCKDHDILNLKGLLHFKKPNPDYALALQQFKTSLQVNPNQLSVNFLRLFILSKIDDSDAKDSKTENLSADEKMQFFTDADAFQPTILHPINFEINLIHLQKLHEGEKYGLCVERAMILDKTYVNVDIPVVDRKRICDLLIPSLIELEKTLPEKLEPVNPLSAAAVFGQEKAPKPDASFAPKTKAEATNAIALYKAKQKSYNQVLELSKRNPSHVEPSPTTPAQVVVTPKNDASTWQPYAKGGLAGFVLGIALTAAAAVAYTVKYKR